MEGEREKIWRGGEKKRMNKSFSPILPFLHFSLLTQVSDG